MTWNHTPYNYQKPSPVTNDDIPLVVVPNPRGGWSLRFSDSQLLIGNYPTAQAAEAYAKTQCTSVRIINPKPATITQHSASVEDTMLHHIRTA